MRILAAIVIAAVLASSAAADTDTDQIQKLLDQAGIKSQGDMRGQMDVVGFVTTAEQMDGVLEQTRKAAEPRRKHFADMFGLTDDSALIAAVCPHDDYFYAGRLYSLIMPYVKARTVVLFGVFHKARYFNCRDKIVFGKFGLWRGPYGPVKVSPLRDEIVKRLPEGNFIVSNEMQMVEHSLEAIVPFLQAQNPEVEIIPILIPYMKWDTLDVLSSNLATVLQTVFQENGMKLGEDVCMIASADAIHYGDAGWGGNNFAYFGTDIKGYTQAVQQDMNIARDQLSGQVLPAKLEGFMDLCVDPNDVMNYRITWCGRFSIPFGLSVASRLTEALESRTLEGHFLGYGTSVSEASLDVSDLGGLGVTAPSNFHHWVGYAAIGYK
jgi:AmmeMemoRadiSam system protein B